MSFLTPRASDWACSPPSPGKVPCVDLRKRSARPADSGQQIDTRTRSETPGLGGRGTDPARSSLWSGQAMLSGACPSCPMSHTSQLKHQPVSGPCGSPACAHTLPGWGLRPQEGRWGAARGQAASGCWQVRAQKGPLTSVPRDPTWSPWRS